MRYLKIILILSGLLWQPFLFAGEPRDPYQHFFNETWGDFSEELVNAREQGKKGILIFFEMDECPFCHYMKENVLNQSAVQDFYREHFLIFTVDIEGDIQMTNLEGRQVKQKDFAFRENRVRATPVFAFFDLEGKPAYRLTGKTAGVEEFMWLGEYVIDEEYKNMPFIRYKQSKRENSARPS